MTTIVFYHLLCALMSRVTNGLIEMNEYTSMLVFRITAKKVWIEDSVSELRAGIGFFSEKIKWERCCGLVHKGPPVTVFFWAGLSGFSSEQSMSPFWVLRSRCWKYWSEYECYRMPPLSNIAIVSCLCFDILQWRGVGRSMKILFHENHLYKKRVLQSF